MLDKPFAGQFRFSISAQGDGSIEFCIRNIAVFIATEDIVGAEMDHYRPDLLCGNRHIAGTKGIDMKGDIHILFAVVNQHISSRIYNYIRFMPLADSQHRIYIGYIYVFVCKRHQLTVFEGNTQV